MVFPARFREFFLLPRRALSDSKSKETNMLLSVPVPASTNMAAGSKANSEGDLSCRGSAYSVTLGGKGSGARSSSRLINKDGSYDIQHAGLLGAKKKHWRNAFHILLEMKWRYVVLALFIVLPLSWTIFAVVFYGLAYANGDFDQTAARSDGYGNGSTEAGAKSAPGRDPCVQNVNGFLAMLLFSIESQETIGYGYRYSTDECKLLLVLLSLQYVFGGVLQACLCAVIWARLLRPKSRGQEVIFSRTACLSLDDSGRRFCLTFRLSDINGTHLVQSGVRLYLAEKRRVPGTRGLFSFQLLHMPMGEDTGRDKVFFLWPTVACHVIDRRSPLYDFSRQRFEKSDLEFVALAEGIVESTGLTVQTRTSYLPSEVQWGYKFKPMNFCEKGRKSKVKIKYDEFDGTYKADDTPDCSPREWAARNRSLKNMKLIDDFGRHRRIEAQYSLESDDIGNRGGSSDET